MKIYFLTLLLAFSPIASAGDNNVVFSKYDKSLSLEGVNEYGAHIFIGSIKVKGNIYFQFDMASPAKAVDILNANFIPTDESLNRLANVISGHLPGRASTIALEPASLALDMVFGKDKAAELKSGNGQPLYVVAEVTMYKLYTGGQCDSRAYWSNKFNVKQLNNINLNISRIPHGC